MSVFSTSTAKHLCSSAGLTPANSESANNKFHQMFKSRTLPSAFADPICPCRCQKQTEIVLCNQISMHRQAARQKSHYCHSTDDAYQHFHMLSDGEDCQLDNYKTTTIIPPKQKPDALTLDNTLQFLREQAANPETLKLIQQQCAAQTG